MDRSLNDGRHFGPYGQELFEDHVSQLLEGGGLMRRLGNAHAPRVGWADLSARIGRNDKPGVLFAAVITGALSDRELRRGLEDTWTTCEWPGRAADHEVWVQLFELAGVDEDHYLHETEVRDRARLPGTVQLFRAAAEGHQTGLSWTTSFERAHWFATRLGAIGGRHHEIYEATVQREAVLASFHKTRSEHEYVIDTGRLDRVIPDIVEPAVWEHLLEEGDRPRPTDQ
ncbi:MULTISPECIES: hypothetical protein [Micrococcaceae]|uniref:Uncharacterized protein n=4 Tax=Actinomycetes TaxID=1760 RepID=A0A2N7S0U5_9MICC|nr:MULTISPECIES: hypothetical protein [Micrococcaceae]MDN5754991.1 hypothetical protein [Micrococcaceae bacterium]MDN5816555.1 hypothetical protein [Yaniella sp.]PCC18390.1 hypothetical protein CIK79_08865 [Brevibacterium aurantiacum]PMQ19759.1 hypothetical protein CIK84_14050 [Glutamicibacter arilaitensis]